MVRLPSLNSGLWHRSRYSVSIRQKLTILLLIIGLVPTLVVSAVGYFITSNELKSRTIDQLASTAQKQEQKINGLLQQRQEDVSTLTNRFDLQSALGDYLTTHGATDRDLIDSILQDRKVQSQDIQSITVTDLKGKVIASTLDANEGKTFSPRQYYVQPDKETTVTIREDERDGINKLNITTNVSVNKKESGVINAVFRMDDIVAAVQDYTGLGATGETVVAAKNDQGGVVSLFPLRFDTDAALHENLDSLKLFSTNSMTITATDYRGAEVYAAPRAIGFADWVIATKMDVDEALAPVVQLRNTLIATLIVSSVVVLAVALWLTSFFTRPILYIAQIAQRIGRGDLSSRVALHRSDEIGLLGDSINTMGGSLRDFVSNIESERNRLAIILNSTFESVLAIDKQGTILIANKAAAGLMHLPITELVGKNIHDVFKPTSNGHPFTIQYVEDHTKTYPDLEYSDHAGAVHFVRVFVAAVKGEQEQKAAQTIVTIHDQTKTRELENMKVDFVSMAAHELRTPLASLRGYIELINYKEGRRIDPEIQKYLRQALKSSDELGGLINNLLDVSHIERGTLTLTMEQVDLAESVSQAVEDSGFAAQDKTITLRYEGPVHGAHVIGDHIALREVINNLITNAIKYTDPGGEVTVSLVGEDGRYVVRVKDTGVGIPRKALPYLFTKFYRVHGGLDSGARGTGLGLFISKSIIERHNGTIGVESTESVGSVFSFSLPVASRESAAAVDAHNQSEQTFIRRHRGWVTKNTTR